MKVGEKMYARFRGRFVPVMIVSIKDFGIECQFLSDSLPVKTGQKMFFGSANLYSAELYEAFEKEWENEQS